MNWLDELPCVSTERSAKLALLVEWDSEAMLPIC